MKRLLILLALATGIAGCTSQGVPVFQPASGPTFERAYAACQKRVRDNLSKGWGAYVILDDANDCFTTQGVHLKGFRQPDGSITRYPEFKGGSKANRFPPAPKAPS